MSPSSSPLPRTIQTKPTSNPNRMEWPFKTLALALIIPILIAVFLVCIALWYGCYYRPRQERQQHQNRNPQQHQQRESIYIEQRVISAAEDPFSTVTTNSADMEWTKDLEPPREIALKVLEGRNGCDEDRTYVPVSVPTSIGDRSRSSSVSSLEGNDRGSSVLVARRRI